jgi:hypothetical protein
MKPGVAAVMFLLGCSQADALPCSPTTMPMPDAEAVEIAIRPDKALETICLEAARKAIQLDGLALGRPSFTRHPKWGDIMRMDMGKPSPNRYSRILCSRYPGQTSVQVAAYDMDKGVCDGHGLVIGITTGPRKPRTNP